MKAWTTVQLIIGREIRAWRKPFLVSTAVVLFLFAAGLTALLVLGNDDGGGVSHRIGTTGATPIDLAKQIQHHLPEDHSVTVRPFSSVETAEAAASAGTVDVVVVGDSEVVWGPSVDDALADATVRALVDVQAKVRAEELGLALSEIERLLTPDLTFRDAVVVEEADQADEVVSVIATIVMFMAILAYGQWIGYAVVEEKANRVVELLLGTVRPHHLMGAKVVSIGALGLTQLAAVGALVLGFGIATQQLGFPSVRPTVVLWALVWFFLGYAFYGSLYAAAGSLASNTQEAGATIGPLTLLLVAGYMVGMISFGEGTGDNVVLRVMSYLPLWSPLVMPGRIARGWAEPWELLLAVVIMAVGLYGMIRLAGWIYAGGVAQATAKLGWGEALRTGRQLGRTSN